MSPFCARCKQPLTNFACVIIKCAKICKLNLIIRKLYNTFSWIVFQIFLQHDTFSLKLLRFECETSAKVGDITSRHRFSLKLFICRSVNQHYADLCGTALEVFRVKINSRSIHEMIIPRVSFQQPCLLMFLFSRNQRQPSEVVGL